MATENIGPTAGFAHISQNQLEETEGSNDGASYGVLRSPHTPGQAGRSVCGQQFSDMPGLFRRNTCYIFHLFGRIRFGNLNKLFIT